MKMNWQANALMLREGEGHAGGGSAEPSERERMLETKLGSLEAKFASMEAEQRQAQQHGQLRTHRASLDVAVTTAENAVNTAKTALRAALDSGDPDAIAAANVDLASAAADVAARKGDRDRFDADVRSAERRQGGARSGGASGTKPLDTSNLEAWKSRNSNWYGIDPDMTKVSHEIDAGVRQSKQYAVGSREYFDAIDRAMRARFPDRFSGAGPSPSSQSGAGDPPPSNGRRYDAEVQRAMAAFGMTPEQWDASRKIAVSKGVLPETPARGRAYA